MDEEDEEGLAKWASRRYLMALVLDEIIVKQKSNLLKDVRQ